MDIHHRYAALVARQLAAILAEDLAEYERLAVERDAAAAAIEQATARGEPAGRAENARAAEARECLRRAAELDAQLLEVLRDRRSSLRARLDAAERSRTFALAYARAASPAGASSFDVSL